MRIQAVFFDLGSTLIYSQDPWPPVFQRADRALVEVLQRAGFPVDLGGVREDFATFMQAYYAQRDRDQDNFEPTSYKVLGEMLAKKGFRSVPGPVLRAALDAVYAITQSNWHAEDDAIPTLESLQSRGYRLALISNTSDDKNVQDLVDRFAFRPYFETIVTSAALGVRKPDRRIFMAALDHLGIAPEHTAMVGDTPDADILGANQMGMFSIWIIRRVESAETIIPARAIVRTLNEVPFLLSSLPPTVP